MLITEDQQAYTVGIQGLHRAPSKGDSKRNENGNHSSDLYLIGDHFISLQNYQYRNIIFMLISLLINNEQTFLWFAFFSGLIASSVPYLFYCMLLRLSYRTIYGIWSFCVLLFHILIQLLAFPFTPKTNFKMVSVKLLCLGIAASWGSSVCCWC